MPIVNPDYTAQVNTNSGPLAPAPIDMGAPFRALENLGDQIYAKAKAERDKEIDRKNQAVAVQIATKARIELEKEWLSRSDKATGDAKGVSAAWETELPDLIKTYVDQAPEGARGYVEQRLLSFQEKSVLDAFAFERDMAVAQRVKFASEAVDAAVNAIRTGGSDFDSALGDVRAAIGSAGLSASAAEKLSQSAESDLAYAYVAGLNERNPGEARRILEGGGLDGYLTPEAKNRVVNDNFVELRRRDAEAKAEAREAARDAQLSRELVKIEVAQLQAADLASIEETGKGVPSLTSERIREALGEKGAAKYEHARLKAEQIYQATAGFETETPDAMRARLTAMRPQEGSETYDIDAEAYRRAEVRMTQILDAREKDPAGAMLKVKPVMEAADRVQKAPDDPAAWSAYINAQDVAQEAAGIPAAKRRYLPKAMAEQRVEQIMGLSPAQRGQALRNAVLSLPELYGDKWRSIHRELVSAGLPATSEIFAMNITPRQMQTAANGIDAAPILKDQLSKADKDAMADAVNGGIQPFLSSLAGAADSGTRAADTQAMVEALAAGYIAEGKSPAEAGELAAADWNAQYSYAGSIRVPVSAQVPAFAVARQAQRRLESAKPEDFTPYDPTEYETLYDAQEAYLDSLLAEGRWVNAGDGKGLILHDANGLPARDRAGNVVRLDFEQARQQAVEDARFVGMGEVWRKTLGYDE